MLRNRAYGKRVVAPIRRHPSGCPTVAPGSLMTGPDPPVLRGQLADAAGSHALTGWNDAATRLHAKAFFWLDLSGPSPKQISELVATLGLTEDDGEYLRTTGQRSAFEVSHSGVRAVAYGAGNDQELVEVHVVYTSCFVVTVHQAPCPALDQARDLYGRLNDPRQGNKPVAVEHGAVLWLVLDTLIGSFHLLIGNFAVVLDQMEAAVLGDVPVPDYVPRVLEIRRTLTSMFQALGLYYSDLVGVRHVIQQVPGMGPAALETFESHRSHVAAVTIVELLSRGETRDALQVYGDAATGRQGQVINWLTVVAAIFLPLTFLTGYFGMNFGVILGLRGWPIFIALAVILPLLLVTTTVTALRYMTRRLGVHFLPQSAARSGQQQSGQQAGQHE